MVLLKAAKQTGRGKIALLAPPSGKMGDGTLSYVP